MAIRTRLSDVDFSALKIPLIPILHLVSGATRPTRYKSAVEYKPAVVRVYPLAIMYIRYRIGSNKYIFRSIFL